jgi:poly-gamma-glutamate capsule biosynthesis protein CapA/YwtB (metallophosphatase superfamily)
MRLVAVGDVIPDRDDPATIFDHVRERLTSADLGFCQLEVNLSTRDGCLPQARHTMRGDPRIADALVGTGLEVVSFAGNHSMDWGTTGLTDTLDNLRRAGAQQVVKLNPLQNVRVAAQHHVARRRASARSRS